MEAKGIFTKVKPVFNIDIMNTVHCLSQHISTNSESETDDEVAAPKRTTGARRPAGDVVPRTLAKPSQGQSAQEEKKEGKPAESASSSIKPLTYSIPPSSYAYTRAIF